MAKKKVSSKKKTYTKTHTSAKAAAGHIKKIKARGGKVTSKKIGSKTHLTYSF